MLLLVLAAALQVAGALTVYDCDRPVHSVQAVDLMNPKECPSPERDYQPPQLHRAIIIQTDPGSTNFGFQCLITRSRDVTYCGVDSWTGVTESPIWEERVELTGKQCREIVETGEFKTEGQVFKTPVNSYTTHSYYSHGKVATSGYYANRCETTAFYRGDKYFDNHYEITKRKVTIKNITGSVDLAEGQVTFQNGLRAPVGQLVMQDEFEGTIVWDKKEHHCEEEISLVYQGQAEVHRRRDRGDSWKDALLMVKDQNRQQFAGFVLQSEKVKCNQKCHTTQLRGLLVCLYNAWENPPTDLKFKPVNEPNKADLQAQMAFLHITTQLQFYNKFTQFSSALCELRRSQLVTKLQAIIGANNPYSLTELYGPGHMIVKAGLAAYVIRCARVEATKAEYKNCTEEVPVMINGTLRFADPYSWVVQNLPTVLPCSAISPVRWSIHGRWFCATPCVHSCDPPTQLNVTVGGDLDREDSTRRDDALNALGGGLYSPEQLQQNRAFRISQSSRAPIWQRVTNAATRDVQHDGGHSDATFNLPLHPEDTARLIEAVGDSLLPGFYLLGNTWFYIHGCFIAFIMVKLFVGAAVRGCVLYQTRGCGWWLLAAIFDTFFIIAYTPFHVLKETVRLAKVDGSHAKDPFPTVRRLDRHCAGGRKKKKKKGDHTAVPTVDEDQDSDGPEGPGGTSASGPSAPKSVSYADLRDHVKILTRKLSHAEETPVRDPPRGGAPEEGVPSVEATADGSPGDDAGGSRSAGRGNTGYPATPEPHTYADLARRIHDRGSTDAITVMSPPPLLPSPPTWRRSGPPP